MNEEIMTLKEVAVFLRVHPTTVNRMLRDHKIPAFRIGSDWRFSREAIDEWRRAQEKTE